MPPPERCSRQPYFPRKLSTFRLARAWAIPLASRGRTSRQLGLGERAAPFTRPLRPNRALMPYAAGTVGNAISTPSCMAPAKAAGRPTVGFARRPMALETGPEVRPPERPGRALPRRNLAGRPRIAFRAWQGDTAGMSGPNRRPRPASDAESWDERYRSAARVWSGLPNPQLVAETSRLAPGRALDAGCGEGADALWLARRGWEVVAVDISGVALDRATRHAEGANPGAAPRGRHDASSGAGPT